MKLYQWIPELERTPRGHWVVHLDARRRQSLSVLFPFNFLASAYFIALRWKWEIEGRILMMEVAPWISHEPISARMNDYESPEAQAVADLLVRYGYVRKGCYWVRAKN